VNAIQTALETLLPEKFDAYASTLAGLAMAIIIFVVGWIASKWARGLVLGVLRKQKVDEALARFLSGIAQYTVLAATVVTALGKVGVETASLLALLATAGLAIGLALQGSLSNFAAGVMILFFRPFTIGDRITAAGQTGSVHDIGLFATTLKTPDKETIIISNSEVSSGSIVNYSTEGKLRANIEIGVAYGTDLKQAMEIIAKACAGAELVLSDPESSVAFSGFGASSIDFLARPWAKPNDYPAMQHNARIAIYDALNAAGIEIPFNQIVVTRAE
jgi:small conductance mechanosensitive channel